MHTAANWLKHLATAPPCTPTISDSPSFPSFPILCSLALKRDTFQRERAREEKAHRDMFDGDGVNDDGVEQEQVSALFHCA